MDSILWMGRESIWASCPSPPWHAGPALDAYFVDRRASLPNAPAPTVEGMLRDLLATSGSAPGADNEPYELYHIGAFFVAQLLGQALLAMAVSDEALSCGRSGAGPPSVDPQEGCRRWAW